MSKSVFISHAVKDRELAAEVVTLIEEGIGVPESEIFCSSLQGYGIPTGQNFITYIKAQLLEPKVVVLLLTPAYFESKFCISELGAAWIKSHAIFPILVPPLQYSDVKDVLLGTQVIKIEDDIGYNDLLATLREQIACTEKSQTKWDTKRRAFLKAIEPLLAKVEGPTHVTAADHAKLAGELSEARAELDTSEEEIRKLKKQLAETEALKDRAAVATVQASFADQDSEDDVSGAFNALTDEIKEYRSMLKGAAVMTFVLSDYYNQPYTIEWHSDKAEFEAAARFKYIDLEDGERVNWSNKTMKSLKSKLAELEEFMFEHGRELAKSEGSSPLDPTAQDFWEYHYDL
ncbi:toll/interleukin-1 receptor domain-containing protein [Methylobacterium sp. E-065]|uniref:TIR domain-containing protein n=1 Tax=Methylobacterium sp. E-065 TaxID=2836583 RepID=UPI001FB9DE22|nr:TIR domain-containing protein [Methylobacterium sp. E-065]MCJ2015862.1 toll/interleukin-1 receptor domain-containing protein [Methylobacterium sp. E-065]